MYSVLQDVSGIEKYSNSKLNTIWHCPYAYDITYNQKDRGKQNGFAECGVLAHITIEKYLNKELLQFELEDYFNNNWDEFVPNGVKLKTAEGFALDLTTTYKTQISNYLKNFDGFSIDGEPVKILGVEKEFTLLIDTGKHKFFLNGFLDVEGETQDGDLFILDHKSKKEFKSEKEKQEYARQLYLYSIYIKEKYNKFPKYLIFNLVRTGELVKIKFNEDDFNKAINWIDSSIDKILSEELFLPINFSKELNDFKNIKLQYDGISSLYDKDEIKLVKAKYKLVSEALKDKMFFCANLCNHSENCNAFNEISEAYRSLVKKKGVKR